MPWWAKIGAKVVLSRVPVPYGVWRRLGIFRHGDMGRPEQVAGAVLAQDASNAAASETTMMRLNMATAPLDGFTLHNSSVAATWRLVSTR